MSNEKQDLPEIDSVRTYQAVPFDKTVQTSFTTRSKPGCPGVEIYVNKDYSAIEIKSASDHIMVPFTNVSVISFRSQLKIDQIDKAKKASAVTTGVRNAEIKRPSK